MDAKKYYTNISKFPNRSCHVPYSNHIIDSLIRLEVWMFFYQCKYLNSFWATKKLFSLTSLVGEWVLVICQKMKRHSTPDCMTDSIFHRPRYWSPSPRMAALLGASTGGSPFYHRYQFFHCFFNFFISALRRSFFAHYYFVHLQKDIEGNDRRWPWR